MNLSAPTNIVFIISVVIAIIALLAGTAVISVIPVPAFWLAIIAYAVLAIGCLLKGV